MAKVIKEKEINAGKAPSQKSDGENGRKKTAVIGAQQVQEAIEELQRYKSGKANLENRIIEDEQWYKRRHWDVIRRGAKKGAQSPEPTSGWLFNTLLNKHADAVDSYPRPNVLPREKSDRGTAKMLSDVLPVIIERCGFEQIYSDNWWEKLKHGTAVYGVFWNPSLENGLGDIDIRMIDLLNIFWEPGITDIQASNKLFIVDLWDIATVENIYPHLKGKVQTDQTLIKQYVYDDTIDLSRKAAVVDCYYKVNTPEGRTVLHFMKFCGDQLLYASENDPNYAERGFYDHGMYPVVFDNLFPEKGTPVGFGYVAVTKDPQMYIDKLSANILENAMMATKVRYFALSNTGVNEEEFLDWNKPIVHVEGSSIEDTRLKQITVRPLDGIYFNVLQQKINEMKETAANRDFNAGAATGGVTAASAITALQESGNKCSRDMINAAYRAYIKINYLCIELIRQFYDEARSFRITGDGDCEFAECSNEGLRDIVSSSEYPTDGGDGLLVRRPVFDVTVSAEKRSPFSRVSLNETAKELFRLGVFEPQNRQQANILLKMMDFEGKDQILEMINSEEQQPKQQREILPGMAAGINGEIMQAQSAASEAMM